MFSNPLWNLITLDIGIDLGTANTLVYIKGQGIAVQEPTVVAQHRKLKHTVAVGKRAKEMIGRTPETIRTVRPIASGAIADFEAAQSLIRELLTRVHQEYGQWRRLPKPRVVIGVPARITEVERRAVADAALAAGARVAYLVDESMASALGSGLLGDDIRGRLLIDIGGGTTEIAVVSLDGLVVNRSVPVAGWEMDQSIVNFARDT
jgi:rod shape-determining protein MreB